MESLQNHTEYSNWHLMRLINQNINEHKIDYKITFPNLCTVQFIYDKQWLEENLP